MRKRKPFISSNFDPLWRMDKERDEKALKAAILHSDIEMLESIQKRYIKFPALQGAFRLIIKVLKSWQQ